LQNFPIFLVYFVGKDYLCTREQYTMVQDRSLKDIIGNLPEGSIVFRTDFPQYHPEFVGNILSVMVDKNHLTKIAQGIYLKPRRSKFGVIKPSAYQVAESIAKRDNADILPTGETALNELGLSTQVPVNYTFLTTGSARNVRLGNLSIIFKRSVPRNFAYRTKLMAYFVQALRALGEKNVDDAILSQLAALIDKEPDQAVLIEDLKHAPVWMRKILKPYIHEKTLDKKQC